MRLEAQLDKLAELGLRLDEGVCVDDLLYSFDRESFEERPFDLVLFVLGIEVERSPWERSVCSRVWNFDTECIVENGDYIKIVKRLCLVAGRPDLLEDVTDFVDAEAGQGRLTYKVNGIERNWTLKVDSDWADTDVVSKVMTDIQSNGHRFFSKDNGQAAILFYLDAATARELNRLSGDALQPVLPE